MLSICNDVNLSGHHSTAITLYRQIEDSLDCFGAVGLIAGAAEKWISDKLKPSEAAILLKEKIYFINPEDASKIENYRKVMAWQKLLSQYLCDK